MELSSHSPYFFDLDDDFSSKPSSLEEASNEAPKAKHGKFEVSVDVCESKQPCQIDKKGKFRICHTPRSSVPPCIFDDILDFSPSIPVRKCRARSTHFSVTISIPSNTDDLIEF